MMLKVRLRLIRRQINYGISYLLNWLGIPGFIKPISFFDKVLQRQITIKNSRFYTTLSIGDRTFYFYRLNGGYDGSSSPMNRYPGQMSKRAFAGQQSA